MEKRREAKRKKFHEALLNLYHPPPPPPPHDSPPRLDEAESVEVLYRDTDLEFDPEDGDYARKERSSSSESDCGSKTLTRAQRKRIRKRKLKEGATVRRKVIGPLLPEGYQDQENQLSDGQKKPLDEKSLGHSAN
ncbi:uncharacterized protein LOC109720899 isoform X1 [Ananas comosus]|uniref:Uncharacterized protein LOC109720899 isoform X1 n=1 Tax=Ananas comosus TaxID=4615 RepID=A0A6P5G5G9_ANACO|nr:uncharacterized protein LOC109720899 isoform X1 [Ananas comosus]